ncbi:hypothetical protein AX15_006748 [Amanita polypyramis BW_CC]|nr:hypothetical protein AX15_006748 [Amanita polypyramis BW_CC]
MAESLPPKVKLLKGYEPDFSAATYQIHDESHTIGNALRWMLMKKCVCLMYQHINQDRFYAFLVPRWSFADTGVTLPPSLSGWLTVPPLSNPHPSENVINVRIQMYDRLSSLDALTAALDNLDNLCKVVEEKYLHSLRTDSFERWEEKS